ncbi:MAG: hypothetical protein J5523_10320 [Muribaculaceae bacterium]|nr:hypothetical protein [Muribaculaceae bacterium]
MRRIIYALMSMTMMLIVNTQTIQAENSTVIHRGDTLAVVKGQDTVFILGNEGSLAEQVVSILDDTLAGGHNVSPHGATVKTDPATQKQRAKLMEEMQRSVQKMVVIIVGTLVVGVILIILIVEWFKHKRRKEKYELISKAIENNYPLNEGVLGEFDNKAMEQPPVFIPRPPMQQGPAMNQVQQPMPGQPQMNQVNQPPMQPVAGQINWNAYSSSFTMMAVGIGFMVFFGFAGGWPLIGVFLMVFLIGAFKAFIVWQQQRSMMAAMKQQQAYMPQPPVMGQQQPQAPVQQPEQTNENPTNC